MTQQEVAQKLADWLFENAGYTYNEKFLRGFGIDGEIDLMDMAIFVMDTLPELYKKKAHDPSVRVVRPDSITYCVLSQVDPEDKKYIDTESNG